MPKTLFAAAALLALLTACATPSPTRTVTEQAFGSALGRACLTDTGTRLAPADGTCAASGRTYTHADGERAGAVEAWQLLQLDPAVTIIHH